MMAYIDTKYLGKCETCRHHRSGSCNTFCDCGEEYSPDLSKIPTADVVQKSEVERLQAEVDQLHALLECGVFANSVEDWQKFLNEKRAEVAREIFEEIEKISKAPYGYLCLSNDEYAELKKKYI